MAKSKVKPVKKVASRVSVPEGKKAVITNVEDTVYVVENGLYPDDLAILFKEAQERSYQEGRHAYAKELEHQKQNGCSIYLGPKEAAGLLLQTLHNLNEGDQNEALAIFLREAAKHREGMLQNRLREYEAVKGSLDNAKNQIAAFRNIQNGAYDLLGFR